MTARAWMIAAAVAVLTAGGCAVHGVRASVPLARYSTVFFEGEPTTALRSRLDSVFYAGRRLQVPHPALEWRIGGSHPLLESIAPGARCVWARWSGMRDDYGEGTWVWWNDRLYGLPGLNELLLKAGVIGGDTCDVFLVSKLAVLLYMMGKDDSWGTAPPRAEGELRPWPAEWAWDGPTPKTAFPAIAFDSMWTGIRADTFSSVTDQGTVPAVVRSQGVWMDVTAAGITVLHFVEFSLYNELLQPLTYFIGDAMWFLVPVRASSPSGEQTPRKPSDGDED